MTVTYRESNIRRVKALIVGPPGTPYALGFYQVCRVDSEPEFKTE